MGKGMKMMTALGAMLFATLGCISSAPERVALKFYRAFMEGDLKTAEECSMHSIGELAHERACAEESPDFSRLQDSTITVVESETLVRLVIGPDETIEGPECIVRTLVETVEDVVDIAKVKFKFVFNDGSVAYRLANLIKMDGVWKFEKMREE